MKAPAMIRDPRANPARNDLFHHPEAGSVSIQRLSSGHPDGKPFFCSGTFHATAQAAWQWFCAQWEANKANPPADDNGALYRAQYAHACGYRD